VQLPCRSFAYYNRFVFALVRFYSSGSGVSLALALESRPLGAYRRCESEIRLLSCSWPSPHTESVG